MIERLVPVGQRALGVDEIVILYVLAMPYDICRKLCLPDPNLDNRRKAKLPYKMGPQPWPAPLIVVVVGIAIGPRR